MKEIIHGNCIEEMKKMEECSIDSIITDPPYGIGFMGEKWDKFTSKQFQDFSNEWGTQALRVLKPGSYCLAFSGTRTYHRMVCGLEDAGFNIKDMVIWCYGSGFPKSLDISKAIDKYYKKDKERKEILKPIAYPDSDCWGIPNKNTDNSKNSDCTFGINHQKIHVGNGMRKGSLPYTEDAQKWDGWGTALKPALEPVVVAQKPFTTTYAENVLKYGVGGLNIDKCRIDFNEQIKYTERSINTAFFGNSKGLSGLASPPSKGRFPSNLLLDEISAELLDTQSGLSGGGKPKHNSEIHRIGLTPEMPIFNSNNSGFKPDSNNTSWGNIGDKGGASRFFYCGKAHKSERNAGLLAIQEEFTTDNNKWTENDYRKGNGEKTVKPQKNNISTLKPINIMRYLVRLVTPPNGIVLDPFAGYGTTGIACIIEGFDYILIEKRKRFANLIIPKRLEYWKEPKNWLILKNHNALPKVKELKVKKENNELNKWL